MMVPKLRFSEFNTPWKQVSLGEICADAAYGMNSAATEFDGSNKYIRITDIDDESREFSPSPLTSPSGTLDNKYLLRDGDIVFARTGASVGKSYLYKKNDGNLYFAGFLIRLSINKANPCFVYNQTLTRKYRKWVKIYSMRSGQPGINAEEYKEFDFAIPSSEEQNKIADFLSSVDEKITLLYKQHNLLCQYKKGMIQNIFSQKVRFKNKNGEEFPEWETCKLKKFLIPTLREVKKPSENFLSIGIRSHFKGTFHKDNQDPKKVSVDKLFSVHEGDFIINITFAWEGALAIARKEDNLGYVSHRFPTYTFNKEFIISEFFRYIYILPKFLTYLDLCSPGGAGRNRVLKKIEFLEIEIDRPCLAEQTKIANFLSALDDKIALKKAELDRLKTWKQGLLQQMFV
ncbi:restriction endonuclease subunit S [Serratia nevei]|nr:restriction endonuclease subunit S [Serratia nevei]